MTTKEKKMINKLYESFDRFKDKRITHRRFKHNILVNVLERFKANSVFLIEEVGNSVEGRPIYKVKLGTGKTKILLWSQMHGDESTATMALIDIFNFFNCTDEFDELRKKFFNELSIHFIPMLNPDGAEIFTRRNILNIDINRDALALESPEARILKKIRDQIQPDFGFNLHDKDPRYAVGDTDKLSTISFLAPPYDKEKSINEVREKAMKVIVSLYTLLQKYIPNQMGKWEDEFEPRAFGDNIQKWGTSTILVESGGFRNDPEKQYVRKLNFILLLKAFEVIAEKSFVEEDINVYHHIPYNSKKFFNLVIRNASIVRDNQNFKIDIGINRYEVDDSSGFYYRSVIEEIGDMSIFYGYEEFDARGMEIFPGRIYPTHLTEGDLKPKKVVEFLKEGYTTVVIKDYSESQDKTRYPINFVRQEPPISPLLAIDSNADLVLKEKGEVKYVVINGFLSKLTS